MNCDQALKLMPLIQYSETSFDDEEELHLHLAGCASCSAEFARTGALSRALDQLEIEPSVALLRNSRDELSRRLAEERTKGSWWQGFLSSLRASPVFRPAGAVALVALGFLAARVPATSNWGVRGASLIDPSSARVRLVEAGPSGRVQLWVDETRQRVVTGQLDDANIQALLVAAAKDPSDPGLRGESVELLKGRSDSPQVRGVLVTVLQYDMNAGVRMKALEGLKPYSSRPDVRGALARVLLSDDNPGVRTQAIDLLTQSQNLEHVVGVLQESMQREEDRYIRQRCERALRALNASLDSY